MDAIGYDVEWEVCNSKYIGNLGSSIYKIWWTCNRCNWLLSNRGCYFRRNRWFYDGMSFPIFFQSHWKGYDINEKTLIFLVEDISEMMGIFDENGAISTILGYLHLPFSSSVSQFSLKNGFLAVFLLLFYLLSPIFLSLFCT